MTKAQRDKGKRGERLVAAALRILFPKAARDLNDVYAKKGIDLINTGALAVQVKHYAKHVPLSKFAEIIPGDRIPCLVSWPTDRVSEPLIVFRLSDFIAFAKNPELLKVEIND